MAAPGNFDVEVVRERARLVVSPRGELDLATVGRLKEAVERERRPGEALVVDLRGVSFLDTSGLRYALELVGRAEAEGFPLRFVRGPAPVQRVFEISGLDARLPFVDDPSESAPER